MTKLAIYDKNKGPDDRRANTYFRHDYIYRQNIFNRLGALIGSLILLAVYWFRRLLVQGDSIVDLQTHIINSVLFVLGVMAVYTVIGTIQATRRYHDCQKRLERYDALVRHLERLNAHANRRETSSTDLLYKGDENGATFDRSRDLRSFL